MEENEINNNQAEYNQAPTEEMNLELNENKGPKEGFSFNWITFAFGVAYFSCTHYHDSIPIPS